MESKKVLKKLIFYTDLDGSLLNHHDYSWNYAENTIKEIKSLKIPIIFNTSKTLKEVKELQKEMDVYDPFVIENGGAVWIPKNYFTGEAGRMVVLGKDTRYIRETLENFREKYDFESYSQMTAERIAGLTGLTLADAILSADRLCSEPFIWKDSEDKLNSFRNDLREKELNILKGGRFYHITGFSGKGDALRYINNKYKRQYPDDEIVSVAFGDSPNDTSMLEEADIAVVIPRADGSVLALENKNIIQCDLQSTKGWNQAAEKVLNDYLTRK